MTTAADTLLVFVVLTNLVLLGSSRLGASIRVVAVQGVSLGLLALAAADEGLTWHVLLLAAGGMAVKGFCFPWMLGRSLRDTEIRREAEPFGGYILSSVVGVAILAISYRVGTRLVLPFASASALAVPVGFFTILSGLFIIVTRRQAISQVLGYLVLENGIYALGVALVQGAPLLVELGVLLDVFVAVFVMGIAIFHINREFDHIDTDRLSTLRD